MYDQIFETSFTTDERDAIESAAYVWSVAASNEQLETLFGMLEQDFHGFLAVEDGEGFVFGFEDMTLATYETMELLGISYYMEDRSGEEAA